MPPLCLVDTELFEFPIGPPPAAGEPDDRTVLVWKRLSEQEQRELTELLTVRGQVLPVLLRDALIASALCGWRNLVGRKPSGERYALPWPPPKAPRDFRPQVPVGYATRGLPGDVALDDLPPQLTHLLDVLAVLAQFPTNRNAQGETILDQFYLTVMAHAPDAILKNFSAPWSANDASPASQASATPVGSAARSAARPAKPCPATRED
jgi:hypothetical protein